MVRSWNIFTPYCSQQPWLYCSWHLHIQQDDLIRISIACGIVQHFKLSRPAGSCFNTAAKSLYHFGEYNAIRLIVIYPKDTNFFQVWYRGKQKPVFNGGSKLMISNVISNQKTLPIPDSLVNPIVPFIASTNCLEMVRPSPVPLYLRVVAKWGGLGEMPEKRYILHERWFYWRTLSAKRRLWWTDIMPVQHNHSFWFCFRRLD